MLIVSRMPSGEPEVFASIQGEGVSVGIPSTFVRLATCNLRCVWCDTAYTWDWQRYDRLTQTMTLDAGQLLARVRNLRPRNVVVTGGEPLVQRRELRSLLAVLQQERYRVEIETNGTIGPGDLAELVNQWNVSPKLAHSGNDGLRRMDASVLREFGATAQAWFKFVVSSRDDLDEIRSIAAAAGIDPSRIVLMPEGRTAEEIAGRSAWLVDVCAEYGYRFTTRLHILLWGDRRGT